jgi:pimeloyl-ACP methyl ester carboxylesterase
MRNMLFCHVLCPEYPGYGIYAGVTSAEQILSDVENLISYLTVNLRWPMRNIIVFGRSIGSGPATYIAAKHNPCTLVLMSAYTSISEAVRHIVGGFLASIVRDRFQNIALMPFVTCPTLLIHGQKDRLIPYSHS